MSVVSIFLSDPRDKAHEHISNYSSNLFDIELILQYQ